MQIVQLTDEVRDALAAARPVVALETAVVTHGLPYPQNLQVALDCEQAVREAGAVPATVAVIKGSARAGLTRQELEALAGEPRKAMKLAARDLGAAAASGATGGTTVSASLSIAALAGIRFFSTGGIGGVHRARAGDAPFDVSSDLTQLARSPLTVVSSGAKAILDLPRTVEFLETLGVPVIGYGTNEFPAFYCRQSGLRLAWRADTPGQAVDIVLACRRLGYQGAVLIANPPPTALAMERDELERALGEVLSGEEDVPASGPDVTPFLLSRLVDRTVGKTMAANLALLKANARLAALIAVADTERAG